MAEQMIITRLVPAGGGRHIAVATLSAERTLNALTLDMTQALSDALLGWRDDPAICAVVLLGAGERAFCAGGDIVSLYHAIRSDNLAYCDTFFRDEYALDLMLHQYPKPVLAWGHGVVMGGGLGVYAGASHRVVTESARFAMPEISIGLYPDVGASWWLQRMPGRTGLFAGLTGVHLNAADTLFTGLADFALPAAAREDVLDGLASLAWCDDAELNRSLLSRYLQRCSADFASSLPSSPLRHAFDKIQQLTLEPNLLRLVHGILDFGRQHTDTWWQTIARTLATGSPTSVALVLAAHQRARHMSLSEAFDMELAMSQQCCRGSEFAEGVRALLIDKDKQPRWSPASLDDLTPDHIAVHFIPPSS